MELGNFSIDWKDFEALATKRFRGLVGKPEFSDVTLVSGYGQRIPGHFLQKVVMGFIIVNTVKDLFSLPQIISIIFIIMET